MYNNFPIYVLSWISSEPLQMLANLWDSSIVNRIEAQRNLEQCDKTSYSVLVSVNGSTSREKLATIDDEVLDVIAFGDRKMSILAALVANGCSLHSVYGTTATRTSRGFVPRGCVKRPTCKLQCTSSGKQEKPPLFFIFSHVHDRHDPFPFFIFSIPFSRSINRNGNDDDDDDDDDEENGTTTTRRERRLSRPRDFVLKSKRIVKTRKTQILIRKAYEIFGDKFDRDSDYDCSSRFEDSNGITYRLPEKDNS
ncbi:hypothetical protein V1478_012101 [Vespula squamosa]|uniref:Uncharacterized protein n=1 Tax=Vespula squamosa TaxID=30214 RepID=A0ABD2AEH2_VESSQ